MKKKIYICMSILSYSIYSFFKYCSCQYDGYVWNEFKRNGDDGGV